jgi:hypothetical protein
MNLRANACHNKLKNATREKLRFAKLWVAAAEKKRFREAITFERPA